MKMTMCIVLANIIMSPKFQQNHLSFKQVTEVFTIIQYNIITLGYLQVQLSPTTLQPLPLIVFVCGKQYTESV